MRPLLRHYAKRYGVPDAFTMRLPYPCRKERDQRLIIDHDLRAVWRVDGSGWIVVDCRGGSWVFDGRDSIAILYRTEHDYLLRVFWGSLSDGRRND